MSPRRVSDHVSLADKAACCICLSGSPQAETNKRLLDGEIVYVESLDGVRAGVGHRDAVVTTRAWLIWPCAVSSRAAVS